MRRHTALLAATLTLPLAACDAPGEKPEPRPEITRTLAQAEWDLAPQESRRAWCRVWKAKGEKGIKELPRTGPAAEDEKFAEDFIEVVRKYC